MISSNADQKYFTCMHSKINTAIAVTTVTEPQTTMMKPSTVPVPVSSGLTTLHYVIIAAVSAAVILLSLVMIMILAK